MPKIKAVLLGCWRPMLLILAVGLLARWLTFYYFYHVYTTSGGAHFSPIADEANTYEVLARQLLVGNGFSQELFSYRPPLQPMFIAFIYVMLGRASPLVAAFAQTFVGAGVGVLTFLAARELRTPRLVQLWSGLLVALDPASVIIGLTLMAETLSNVFVAAGTLFTIRLLRSGRLRDAAATGGCIALATLARPTSIYLWVLLLLAIVRMVPRFLPKAAVFMAVFAVGVLPWYVRNQVYHNVFRFSTVGNFNLLFYGAVSVKHWATGESPQELEAQFSYDLDRRLGRAEARDNYDYSSKWKFIVADDPQVNAEITRMALEVFREHPLAYIATSPRRLAKMYAFTNDLAKFGPARWLEIVFNLAFYALSLCGIIWAWLNHERVLLTSTLIPIIYFSVILLFSGSGSAMDTRARTPFAFCLAILAVRGALWLWEWERQPGPI